MYIITARRMISGDVLKYLKGFGHLKTLLSPLTRRKLTSSEKTARASPFWPQHATGSFFPDHATAFGRGTSGGGWSAGIGQT